MSWVLSPISASATTANELQSAVILRMIPRRPDARSGARSQEHGQAAYRVEGVRLSHRLDHFAGARLPQPFRGESEKLRHHLLRRHRVGGIAAHHAGGLGEDAAVA